MYKRYSFFFGMQFVVPEVFWRVVTGWPPEWKWHWTPPRQPPKSLFGLAFCCSGIRHRRCYWWTLKHSHCWQLNRRKQLKGNNVQRSSRAEELFLTQGNIYITDQKKEVERLFRKFIRSLIRYLCWSKNFSHQTNLWVFSIFWLRSWNIQYTINLLLFL